MEIFGIENLVATTSIPVLINEDAVIEESFMNEISQQEGRVLPNKEKVIFDFDFCLHNLSYVFVYLFSLENMHECFFSSSSSYRIC